MTAPTTSARVFLVRHGDTDWISGGKFASRTDIPLSKMGEKDIEFTRDRVVAEDEMIDPTGIAKIYCSPRINARRTVEILGIGVHHHQHFQNEETGQKWRSESVIKGETADPYIHITKSLEEWDFGYYEGMTLQAINEKRMKDYGSGTWDIWTDGCPGGESPQQVTERLDKLIREIKQVISSNSASWPGGQLIAHRSQHAQDVVCVAHGHILAALAIRWVGLPLDTGMMRLIFEPGGVGILGFEHDNINQPAILVGRKPGRPDREQRSETGFAQASR
ncbi:hypothetical protein N7539_000825 [Penicillium diatomitis]|uniref:Uncharacterized protein n=1 Tax=Penicillium diatomitis TaxID=2819901 RepID=A0A9W9XNY2_9EURO|nr:uncharacterized protein N7539_000825 [Penicillium diatomitis]KAJ5495709.1 hypothetical protein N7539_000825 [Penicillium diatomitis]